MARAVHSRRAALDETLAATEELDVADLAPFMAHRPATPPAR